MESKYFRPYVSDSEDSDSESDTSTSSENSYINTLPNFKDFALKLNSSNIEGPSFTDISSQVFYSRPKSYSLFNSVFEDVVYGVTPSTFVDKSKQANLLNVQREQITSIINIDSTNRDKNVYPQPTDVVLRLPRIYRNIVNFQIVQMKLLSAFFYFRKSKENISIPINEQSRFLDSNGNVVTGSNVTDPNFYKVPNIITTNIREGSYDINGLINELNIHLNTPPIFYDFINGISDFIKLFQATGDYGVGFNLPGDYFYDTVLNVFIPNPTLDYIVTRYFQTRYAGLTSYTINQMTIAYYYPVLKEILLDDDYTGTPIDFSLANSSFLNSTETPFTRCVFYFQGLNDNYVLSVINTNTTALDGYRIKHTFRYSLVNKYNVFYDTFNNRIVINCPSLNTSLSNTIVGRSNLYFNQQLASNNLTYSNFINLQNQNTANLIVLTDMYNFLQQQFATNFGVNFNTFSLDYYGFMDNYINVRNGSNAIVSSNYDSNVIIKNLPTINSNLLLNYQTSPPYYWPQLASNNPTNYPNGNNYSNYSGSPFNLITSIPETYHSLNPNDDIYMNRLINHVDAVVDIDPTSYTVFKFKSNLRQTLQIQTLPRPTKYRYPDYNAIAYDVSYNFFSTSVSYVFDSRNSNLVNPSITVTPLPGFASINDTNFGISLSNSYALWLNSFASISQIFPRDFYSFVPPYASTISGTTKAFKYNIALNVSAYPQGSTFPIDTSLFVYHDIGAFYADISGSFNESPYNYLSSNLIPANTVSQDIVLSVFQTPQSNQTYYLIFRAKSVSPINVNYIIAPYFPNGTQYSELSNNLSNFDPLADPQSNLNNWIYANSYDTNYVALPSYSNLYNKTPYSNAYFTDLSYNYVPIGYDSNGVSTDLTSYIGYIQNQPPPQEFTPNALLRIDPINGFIFRATSPYNSTTQTYFYTNSSNQIYTSNSVNLYNPTTVSYRNFAQVHYYSVNYLPNSITQPVLSCNISQTIAPFTQTSFTNTLSNYVFNSTGNIDFGNGVYGLSLIPGEGTWDIQKYMFKSIFIESYWSDPNPLNYQSDPNLKIQYLGIFYTTSLINKDYTTIKLSNAISRLTFSKSVTYNSSNIDYGFGNDNGTFYEFVKQSGSYLYGFTENSNSITTDYNNAYTVCAFDAQSNILPFIGVAGSLVPYPYYSDAVASNAYFDGTTTSNGASIIVPVTKAVPDLNRGPPTYGSPNQSQYEQSLPIGTTFQMIAQRYSLLSSNSMYGWSNINYKPNAIFMDISGFMMTQESEFKIYTYSLTSSNRQFTYVKSFTIDEFFTYNSNISLMGVSANSSEYAFLAFSNDPTLTVGDSIIIKTYNPNTDSVTNCVNSSWIFGVGGKVASNTDVIRFTYNDFGGYTISYVYYNPSKVSYIYALANSNSSNYILCSNVSGSDPASLSHYCAYQNPTEFYGSFYITTVDNSSSYNTLSKVVPSNVLSLGQRDTYALNRPYGIDAQINGSGSYVKVYDYYLSLSFDQFVIDRIINQDVLYGYTSNNSKYFYQFTSFSAGVNPYDSNINISPSATPFPNSIQEMEGGYNGALWFVDVFGNIYGNRYTAVDSSSTPLTVAWQLFYPVQRVIYKNISKSVNTFHDLSGLTYAEYPHTQIFAYSNDASFIADISGNGALAPWGNESNYFISDTQYSGIYFNAYTTFIPLESNNTPYYIALRNYSPTEKSQVYVRITVPKRYDFGYLRFSDLSNEIVTLSNNINSFNPNYAKLLQTFNSNFIWTTKTFGTNIVSGFGGLTLSNIVGFGDFMKYYNTLYNTYINNITIINTINSNTSANLSNFIAYDLQYIIPPTATNRQKYTDPLLYSILWKSQLPAQYAKLDENWGLGFNLGYIKQDTDYDIIHRAESFYKILDDYINLRMNQEFDFNRVDITAKENLSQTLESTGGTKQYYGKLLLANFGSYAQTMVMNPITFNPPLGRLDKLHFSWVDNTNQIIDNADCEWNAVIQIVENSDMVQIPDYPLLNPR